MRSNAGNGGKRNSYPTGLARITPGHDMPPNIPLKVGTRVRIPLGLPGRFVFALSRDIYTATTSTSFSRP
jgi:hypothetical protein